MSVRRSLALGCVGLFLVAGCGPIHLFGRYDYRTGVAQEQRQGGDLVDDLLDEALRGERNDAETSAD